MPAGWPGVFSPKRHYVPTEAAHLELAGQAARRLGLAGLKVWFAICNAPCWQPDDSTHKLQWCPICERASPLQWPTPPSDSGGRSDPRHEAPTGLHHDEREGGR